MPGRNGGATYRYAYQGQEKDPETGWEAFELRMYDGRFGRWMTTDPYSEFHSPYLAMGNNPIGTIDPDGGHTNSTHIDADGNVLAVYDDGDLNIYQHTHNLNLPGRAGENEKYREVLREVYGTSLGGKKVGKTLIWDSFYDHGTKAGYGKIDLTSTEAGAQLMKFTNQMIDYYKTHDEVELLLHYGKNAGNGGIYDFKSNDMPKNLSNKGELNYKYRASQISKGIYMSARDVGNLQAGFIFGSIGMPKYETLILFGVFNANGNKLNKGMIIKALKTKNQAPYGEDWNSHKMQAIGWNIGTKTQRQFAKKAKK